MSDDSPTPRSEVSRTLFFCMKCQTQSESPNGREGGRCPRCRGKTRHMSFSKTYVGGVEAMEDAERALEYEINATFDRLFGLEPASPKGAASGAGVPTQSDAPGVTSDQQHSQRSRASEVCGVIFVVAFFAVLTGLCCHLFLQVGVLGPIVALGVTLIGMVMTVCLGERVPFFLKPVAVGVIAAIVLVAAYGTALWVSKLLT